MTPRTPHEWLAQAATLRGLAVERETSAYGRALLAEAAEAEAAAGAMVEPGELTDDAPDRALRYWDGVIWMRDARPGPPRPRWWGMTPEIGGRAP